MRGAIAAGHPLTAEAGARVLEAGGTAVDACVAAACVSWVCESPLTGPGGGGFMLVHDARDGRSRLYDFFVAVPRARTGLADLLELAVDFDGDTRQVFRTGAAAVGVPGTALGLAEAHRRWGRVPWAELVAPAARLAREGVELTPAQGYLHRILDGLLRHSPEGDAMYGPGRALAAGERFAVPELAETLERVASEGAGALYRGELAERIVGARARGRRLRSRSRTSRRTGSCGGARSRCATAATSSGRTRRRPAAASSSGSASRSSARRRPTAEAVAAAMEAQEAVRGPAFVRRLSRGGAAKSVLSGTTHISVVDAHGGAASLSASLGSGSGVVVPGTGIHLNNMLGEADLTEHARPGARLTSMMAPSIVLRDGVPRLVVGSAGSARLRGAILQVVANVVGAGMGVEEAVEALRIHVEAGVVHCEDPAVADRFEAAGREVVRFRRRNLYFGGVSAVEVRADGSLAAAGDPRRGGAGLVVA